jgi:hypothetical protein
MEDPWATPPDGVWQMTKLTASEPRDVVIAFEQGVPVSLDGERLALWELIVRLNQVVGSYGWGRLDMVENRRVGIKSRETYEAPGALAVMLAHADLESITLERDVQREKIRLEHRYAELVYDGLWFSPLKAAFDAFIDETQRHVTGEVRLRLEPGTLLRDRPDGPRSRSTTTASRPTTPRTVSATRTRRASCSSGASACRPGLPAREPSLPTDSRREREPGLRLRLWPGRRRGLGCWLGFGWGAGGADAVARPIRVRACRRADGLHRLLALRPTVGLR